MAIWMEDKHSCRPDTVGEARLVGPGGPSLSEWRFRSLDISEVETVLLELQRKEEE